MQYQTFVLEARRQLEGLPNIREVAIAQVTGLCMNTRGNYQREDKRSSQNYPKIHQNTASMQRAEGYDLLLCQIRHFSGEFEELFVIIESGNKSLGNSGQANHCTTQSAG